MIRSLITLVAIALAPGACASSGAVPRPFPTPAGRTPSAPAPEVAAASLGYAVSSTALSLQGAPYRAGGADPSGFDCSGLVRFVFAQHGLALPRSATEQHLAGRPIELRDLAPGDLVFFSAVPPDATHVGIAIGGDQFVHAPSERGTVRVERLSTQYWSARLIGARRVL